MAKGYNLSKRANKRMFRKNAIKTHVSNMPGTHVMRGGSRKV